MKAVILAAGEGERLSPLTNTRPKPMLPVSNRPLLEHVIRAVKDAGIDEIVLVVGYKRDRIQSHFGDGDDWDVDIEYAIQDKQLGTGDAVARAKSYVSDDFIVLNGDRILDPSIIESVASARKESEEDAIAVTNVNEPGLYGVIARDETGYVTAINEKPPVQDIQSDLINAGVYGFGEDIFDRIEETTTHGELQLTTVLNQHLADFPIRTIPYSGQWMDVSRPWDLVSVNGDLLDQDAPSNATSAIIDSSAVISEAAVIGENTRIDPNTTISRGTAIGDNVTIGSNVTISNSIIMDDVRIRPSSVIQDAVIGANATIEANVTAPGGKTDVVLKGVEHEDVTFGGIVGDNASVGACSILSPGTRLGNAASVEEGCVLRGEIEPNAIVRRG